MYSSLAPEGNNTEQLIGAKRQGKSMGKATNANDRFAKTIAEVVPAAGTSFQPLADETMTDTDDRTLLSRPMQQAS